MTNLNKFIGTSFATLALTVGLAGCGLTPTPFETAKPEESTQTPVNTNEPQTTEQPTTVAPEPVEKTDAGNSLVMTDMAAETEGYAYPYPVTDYNTEEYAAVEESGFVSTKSTPLSTVSADVDTASYANLRRMLREGYRVASDKDAKAAEEKKQQEEDRAPDGREVERPDGH